MKFNPSNKKYKYREYIRIERTMEFVLRTNFHWSTALFFALSCRAPQVSGPTIPIGIQVHCDLKGNFKWGYSNGGVILAIELSSGNIVDEGQ